MDGGNKIKVKKKTSIPSGIKSFFRKLAKDYGPEGFKGMVSDISKQVSEAVSPVKAKKKEQLTEYPKAVKTQIDKRAKAAF